jgi:pyrroline-5-carboxylate reductase
MPRLQLIGGGKMGEALLGGLVERGWAPAGELIVVEPSAERRDALAVAVPGVVVADAPVAGVDAVIAVKPDIVGAVLAPLAEAAPVRVLSIAAGVRTGALEAGLRPGTAVVRCMPNTPALVGQGAAAIAAGSAASTADLAWAAGILSAVGLVVTVDEDDLDAVTGLSGSGPAYVFLLAEALTAAGIAQGLSPDVADTLTRQTLLGAATLLSESGEDPAVLRANVTSPGGTTAAGLAVFADGDLAGLVDRVVAAATARSVELGGESGRDGPSR